MWSLPISAPGNALVCFALTLDWQFFETSKYSIWLLCTPQCEIHVVVLECLCPKSVLVTTRLWSFANSSSQTQRRILGGAMGALAPVRIFGDITFNAFSLISEKRLESF